MLEGTRIGGHVRSSLTMSSASWASDVHSKRSAFLQESIKRETPFTEVRDESAEGGEAPCDPLNPLYVLDQAHLRDG